MGPSRQNGSQQKQQDGNHVKPPGFENIGQLTKNRQGYGSFSDYQDGSAGARIESSHSGICRSGNRSILAAYTLQLMGYENVKSLKTGLKGWTDYEQPLVDNNNKDVDIDDADEYFASKVRPEQMKPK